MSYNLSSIHPDKNTWMNRHIDLSYSNWVINNDPIAPIEEELVTEKNHKDPLSLFCALSVQRAQQPHSPFEKLPVEIWMLILQHFSFREIYQFREVNYQAYTIANRILPFSKNPKLFINVREMGGFLHAGPSYDQLDAVIYLYQFVYSNEAKHGNIRCVKKLLEKDLNKRTINDVINSGLFENKNIEKLLNTKLTEKQVQYLTSQKFIIERVRDEPFDLDTFLLIPDQYLDHGVMQVFEELDNSNADQASEDSQIVIDHANVVRVFRNARDHFGATPLHHIAAHGNIAQLTKLIEWGAQVNIQDYDGMTPLHYAAEHDFANGVELLLKNGADPHLIDKEGCTPLQHAAHKKHANNVQLLMDTMDQFDALDYCGQAVLHYAAQSSDLTFLIKLMDKKIDMHILDYRGRTALHYAVDKAFAAAYKYLIAAGIPINHRDRQGLTALHIAAKNNDVETIKWLIDHHADIDIEDKQGWTAMHHAAYKGHEKMVATLTYHKANVNAKSRAKETPLHWAAQTGKIGVVRKLLEAGALPMEKDIQKRTALNYAFKFLYFDIMKILISSYIFSLKRIAV